MEDRYKTIRKPSEILFKEKKSKFFGYAYPISTENDVKPLLEKVKKKHPSANHICYAWQLGIEPIRYRAQDDGEPTNTAGMPIYGQIQSFGITNVLIMVARIFGGTKLGTGGLIAAYREAARMSLENAEIVQRTLKEHLKLTFRYASFDSVMRTIKRRRLTIVCQELDLDCKLTIAVKKSEVGKIRQLFQSKNGIEISST